MVKPFQQVRAQEHGNGIRPVAYGKILPLIVKGKVPGDKSCSISCCVMVKKAQTIVLGHFIVLHTSHIVNIILLNITTQHMTSQRHSSYEHILTGIQKVDYFHGKTNPAVDLKDVYHGTDYFHDCMDVIKTHPV